MNRRRLLIVIPAGLVALFGLIGYVLAPQHSRGVTLDNFRRLHVGSTYQDVERVFGPESPFANLRNPEPGITYYTTTGEPIYVYEGPEGQGRIVFHFGFRAEAVPDDTLLKEGWFQPRDPNLPVERLRSPSELELTRELVRYCTGW